MIYTKLILVEGPPGSGKSTTAQKLAQEISAAGISCQCFVEWSADHPISIGDDFHLDQVVKSAITAEDAVREQWQRFSQTEQAQKRVTLMESRFWQTGVMLMYIAGRSRPEIFESNQRIIETVQGLNPVLILFSIEDLPTFFRQVIRSKEIEWQQAGNAGGWTQHILEALENQKWFTDRGKSGVDGLIQFFEDWAQVSEELYARLPFPKIKIRNPYANWSLAMRQIQNFLDLD